MYDLHILQHALGLDRYGQGNSYRSHFVTTEGTDDYLRCMAHVDAGRMVRHGPGSLYGGQDSYCFVVTDAGRAYVAEHSPEPPARTRSQRRYQAYLDMDLDMSFGDWLRAGYWKSSGVEKSEKSTSEM